MTESAVTAAINRLRRRFATTIRAEGAQTVWHRDEIDEEIRYLVEIRSR
jgi:hypothetical protein